MSIALGKRYGPRISRPYSLRPSPPDFRQRYIEGGWEEVELEYRARTSVIARWIMENGGDELREARTAYLREQRAQASVARAKRRGVS